MNYTKGKLYTSPDEFGRAKGIGIHADNGDEGTPLIVAFCWTDGCEEVQKANANRLVQCWNSHDDLLEACKEASKAIQSLYAGAEVSAGSDSDNALRYCLSQIQAAIAKAEGGEK
jgi:hypothetical protein